IMELYPIMIAIDDAHNMDNASWKLLYNAARAYHHIICVLTISQTVHHSNYIDKILHGQNTIISMTTLDPSYVGILACQILNVIGIHKDIVSILQKYGRGNKQWIKTLIQYLDSQDYITCVSYPVTPQTYEKFDSNFIFPYKKFFDEELYNQYWSVMENKDSKNNTNVITMFP
ncbi:uncharacterized protein LOC111617501, partial [Centruroides sculpturatus]|uniref:uncharacterized protein LOC111617501 n=1 Tax=Centruroides sculpturatus TaxID=218467 RepID=UPI000C6DD14C